jgi:hypothetical protein
MMCIYTGVHVDVLGLIKAAGLPGSLVYARTHARISVRVNHYSIITVLLVA